jgi:hypothetical protein
MTVADFDNQIKGKKLNGQMKWLKQ